MGPCSKLKKSNRHNTIVNIMHYWVLKTSQDITFKDYKKNYMYLKIITTNLSLPDFLIHFSLPTSHTASFFQNDAKSVSMRCMTEGDLTEKFNFLSWVDCQAFFLKALISLPLVSVERGLQMTAPWDAIECDHQICKVLFVKDIRPSLSINTDLIGTKSFIWLLSPLCSPL